MTFTEDRQSSRPSRLTNYLTPRPTLPRVPLFHGGSFRPGHHQGVFLFL